jgi:hypothetical protein
MDGNRIDGDAAHVHSAALRGGEAGFDRAVCPGFKRPVVEEEGREVPRGTVAGLRNGTDRLPYLNDEANQRKYVQQGWNLTGRCLSA